MPLLILFIIVLIGTILLAIKKPRPIEIHIYQTKGTEAGDYTFDSKTGKIKFEPEQSYWNGPVPSKTQEAKNKAAIMKHIEQFPNGILAELNPEHKEEYLNSIKLDLPPGIHTE